MVMDMLSMIELLPAEFDSALLGYAVSGSEGRSYYLPVYQKNKADKIASSQEFDSLLKEWKKEDNAPLFLEYASYDDAVELSPKKINLPQFPSECYAGLGYIENKLECAVYDTGKCISHIKKSIPNSPSVVLFEHIIPSLTSKRDAAFLIATPEVVNDLKASAMRYPV